MKKISKKSGIGHKIFNIGLWSGKKSLLRGVRCTSPVPLLDHSYSVLKSAIAD